jgi:hypothetical protein
LMLLLWSFVDRRLCWRDAEEVVPAKVLDSVMYRSFRLSAVPIARARSLDVSTNHHAKEIRSLTKATSDMSIPQKCDQAVNDSTFTACGRSRATSKTAKGL